MYCTIKFCFFIEQALINGMLSTKHIDHHRFICKRTTSRISKPESKNI